MTAEHTSERAPLDEECIHGLGLTAACVILGDLGAETAEERRRELRHEGWHLNLPGGRDICGGCWDGGAR